MARDILTTDVSTTFVMPVGFQGNKIKKIDDNIEKSRKKLTSIAYDVHAEFFYARKCLYN